jgi:hypothetical protein
MYHTTGLTKGDIAELCTLVHETGLKAGLDGYPPILGLYKSVVVTLTYLRRNHVQAELAEYYGVSQPTISRAVAVVTRVLARGLREFVPTAEELAGGARMIVDGSLLPCWSWRSHPELYSGKHKTTGMNVQVACDLSGGGITWVSDPVPGSRHDTYCLKESKVRLVANPGDWIGDKGYVGNGMITPFKKPKGGELLDWQKEFNTAINKIRWRIEQAIAHLKNWRILHTDYRRPINTFATTISAVVGLYFWSRA